MYNPAEFERRCERVRTLLETHDLIYDSLSRPETDQAGFGEPVRRTYLCACGGIGCGQCERSAARAAELDIKLKPGRVLVLERDSYDTGRETGFDPAARTRRERAKLIDDTIDRLQEQELVRQGVYAAHVQYEEVLERAEQRDSRGSYRELRAAKDAMPPGLTGDAAVRWIARWIPGEIRIPQWARREEADRIADQIVALKTENPDLNVQEIASALAIGRSQVRRVLRERRNS